MAEENVEAAASHSVVLVISVVQEPSDFSARSYWPPGQPAAVVETTSSARRQRFTMEGDKFMVAGTVLIEPEISKS